MTMRLALVGILAFGAAIPVDATTPVATPQRPSFSSDTSTTSPGSLEVEFGLALDDAEGRDTPLLLKWGATERTELFVGWSPLVQVDLGDDTQSGPGDATLGVRTRVHESDENGRSWAVQLSTKLPTADDAEGLGSGATDVSVAAIATQSAGEFGLVAYLQSSALGEPTRPEIALEHAFALAAARSIREALSGFAEIALVHAPELDTSYAQTTIGVGYSLSDRIVLDAALAVARGDVELLSFAAGITANLGRVVD